MEYELFEDTRSALIDGTLSLVISHPLQRFAHETISTLVKANEAGPDSGARRFTLGFDIQTSENV